MEGHPTAPPPVPPAPTDRTADFHKTIAADTEKKQLLLTHLRNQANELLELGIDPDNTETIAKRNSRLPGKLLRTGKRTPLPQ